VGDEVFNLNWNFILGILSGFIMLMMSFEAISREKLSGTLRLLSINGFKRQSILWCKYLSYMILYFIIIIPPALISMLLFFTLTGSWDVTYMLSFLLILLISIPFASFFVFLGIFISMSKNYRSSIVLVISIWLLFVIIIPQSANIFGKQISPIKTNTEYSQHQRTVFNNEFTERRRIMDEIQERGELENWGDLHAIPVNYADEKRNQVELQRLDDNKKQLQTVEKIARISPFIQYEKISEIIFNKGLYLQRFQEETMRNTIFQVRNLIIEQDSRDEKSSHMFYSQAVFMRFFSEDGEVTFSDQKFEHPNLMFVTDVYTDDALLKTQRIIIWLIPVLVSNLLLMTWSVVKLERLDIR